LGKRSTHNAQPPTFKDGANALFERLELVVEDFEARSAMRGYLCPLLNGIGLKEYAQVPDSQSGK
jgi:hypothetical protein